MTTPIRQVGVCSVFVEIPNGRKRGKQAFYFDESIKLQGPAFFSYKGTMNASHAEMVASVANSSRIKWSVWRRLILLLFTTLRRGAAIPTNKNYYFLNGPGRHPMGSISAKNTFFECPVSVAPPHFGAAPGMLLYFVIFCLELTTAKNRV